jgi:NADH:ubiquinone oxidoreductase subunit 2 (subunit N)
VCGGLFGDHDNQYADTPIICITYLTLYFITVTPIFISITYSNITTTTQINTNQKAKSTHLILLLLTCSLAGIPPLTGFLPTLLAIYTLMPINYT